MVKLQELLGDRLISLRKCLVVSFGRRINTLSIILCVETKILWQ